MQKSNAVKFILLMLLAALLLYIAYSSGLQDYVSQKAILALLENMGSFAPLGFMAVMALTVVSPLPSLPLDIAAGIFFGPYLPLIRPESRTYYSAPEPSIILR